MKELAGRSRPVQAGCALGPGPRGRHASPTGAPHVGGGYADSSWMVILGKAKTQHDPTSKLFETSLPIVLIRETRHRQERVATRQNSLSCVAAKRSPRYGVLKQGTLPWGKW